MISEKNLQHPVLVLMFFALLGIMGLFTLNKVSIALMPDTDMPYLSVSATYTNAGPESLLYFFASSTASLIATAVGTSSSHFTS